MPTAPISVVAPTSLNAHVTGMPATSGYGSRSPSNSMAAAGANRNVGRASDPALIWTVLTVPPVVDGTCTGSPARLIVMTREPVGVRSGTKRQPSPPVVYEKEFSGWSPSTPTTSTSLTGPPTWLMMEIAAAPVPSVETAVGGVITVSATAGAARLGPVTSTRTRMYAWPGSADSQALAAWPLPTHEAVVRTTKSGRVPGGASVDRPGVIAPVPCSRRYSTCERATLAARTRSLFSWIVRSAAMSTVTVAADSTANSMRAASTSTSVNPSSRAVAAPCRPVRGPGRGRASAGHPLMPHPLPTFPVH